MGEAGVVHEKCAASFSLLEANVDMETAVREPEVAPAEPVLMTTEQVRERMQIAVTRQTIRNWVNNGMFPRPRTIGGRWYFVESEFNKWWQERMK